MRLKALAFTSFKLPPLPLLQPLKGRSYYLLPLKGSSYSFTLSLSNAISCFSCSSIYFLMVASFNPTVLTSYPSAHKCLFPNFYFKFACLSNIINPLFPFKYPIKLDTLIFGGILTSSCTCSGIICPSIISTPLYLHNCRKISLMLALYWLYIIFLLYFGVNTICVHLSMMWDWKND